MSASKAVLGVKPCMIAIANQKGGVGKSTTAVNLAVGLAKKGHRVLLVDFDPAGGATAFVGLANEMMEREVRLLGVTDLLQQGVFKPRVNHLLPGLDVLPATARLADYGDAMIQADSHLQLARRLGEVAMGYDFVLIDTQPTLSRLQIAALIAAPKVIMPVQTELINLPMVVQFRDTVEGLAKREQPAMQLLGVLPTLFNTRANAHHAMLTELRSTFGEDVVFQTPIARRQSIADAQASGRPIVLASNADEGAIEYNQFIEEVERRATR